MPHVLSQGQKNEHLKNFSIMNSPQVLLGSFEKPPPTSKLFFRLSVTHINPNSFLSCLIPRAFAWLMLEAACNFGETQESVPLSFPKTAIGR